MTNLNAKWALFTVFAVSLVLTTSPILSGPVLANKRSDAASVLANPSMTAANATAHYHMNGVKVLNVLNVNAKQSRVVVSTKFSIRDTDFNNSSDTITITNGTCTSPLPIGFKRTVAIENQADAASCKAPPQHVILTSGEQSAILSPSHSGMAYKETNPATANATIPSNYGPETPIGKFLISDNISSINAADIKPSQQNITSSQPRLLSLHLLFPNGTFPNPDFHPSPTAALAHAPSPASALPNSCNCVIFRLDDVQDYWISNVQSTVMDQFIAKNVTLNTGLIMNHFGSDTNVVNKVAEGYKKGLFELFNHGWDHVNFTGVSLGQQKTWLSQGNAKMQSIFGRNTTVFIPPYDGFDNNTLTAMKSLGFKIISSETDLDPYPQFNAGGSKITDIFGIYQNKIVGSNITDIFGIYHLSPQAQFYNYSSNVGVKVPVSQVLSQINTNINDYGYSVVVLHPQDFMQVVKGRPTKLVNQTDINDLNTIINTQLSKNRKIESFSQVAGVALPPLEETLPSLVPPSIQAPADIVIASNSTLTKVSLGTPTVTDNADPSPTITNNAPSAGYPQGTTIVTWTATDHSGNSARAAQQVTITKSIDTTYPVLSVNSPSSGATINGPTSGAVITVTGTASDVGSGVDHVEVRTSTTSYNAATPKAPHDWSTWKYTIPIKQAGNNTVIGRVTDYYGNQKWVKIPITVKLAAIENSSQYRLR